MPSRLILSGEVARALRRRRPVVALETTLITHGLPAPEGLRTARDLERAVREHGAVPATIGILAGAVRVGLAPDELEALAGAGEVAKVNPGNLAAVIAGGGAGSTTVAATMFVAARTGIRVFATGGIGGVHRDVSESGDVSADLAALARFPVAVICSGAKAILDLPRTVEMLETLGVPVLGFRAGDFPAFYRRASGLPVDRRCDTVDELAAVIRAHWTLGFRTGVLVGNPVPEADELPADVLEPALEASLAEAAERGLRGRDVTPFLLERLRERTAGATVRTNVALLLDNARVAAGLARSLSRAEDAAGTPV
ncbi:MAG TPA: pseudouridine-5'-phosphate glycosidase [Terriglobales bacterium]|nr:pseudouridine-5'-phosphate glycosidase [Terriglobales bacterium]